MFEHRHMDSKSTPVVPSFQKGPNESGGNVIDTGFIYTVHVYENHNKDKVNKIRFQLYTGGTKADLIALYMRIT